MAKTNNSIVSSKKNDSILAQEKIVQLKKDEIAADAEITRNAKRKLEHYESLQKAGTYLNDTIKKEIEFLKQDLKLHEEKEKSLKDEQKALSKLYELENKRKKLLKESISDADEFATSLRSLGVQVGKDNKLFEAMNSHIDSVATTLDSVGKLVSELGDDQLNLKKQVIASADGYKNLNTNITVAGKKLMQQKTTQSEYNTLIKESYESLDESISKIDQSTDAGKELYEIMVASRKEMESFYQAAVKSEKQLQAMNGAIDQFASSGIPAAREMGNVLKSAAEGGKGLGVAMAALGAAAGALAYDMGLVGDKFGTIASYDKDLIGIQKDIDLIDNKIKGAFAGETALGNFGFQMQQMGAQFQAASKTALFGKGLGSVGYGAGQLQLAGISAETIASQMQAAGDATGKMPSSKVAADMAVLANRTGQSAEGAATLNEMFMRTGGYTADTALNMQDGLRAMADQAGINLGGLMAEMAESSKEMLGYQIKSGSALARQVTFARSMGVSFADIAKAGQSMVLNYKDSIKSEMQLSAMLGKNVDLSEVRSSFAAGDTEGALKALKAQGLDPANMDMFQQQMLQQATGMDLTTLSKLNSNTGTTSNLGAGNAKAGNSGFLSAKQQAEAGLQVANAKIQVDQAAFNITQDAKAAAAVQDAIMKNTYGRKDLEEKKKQTETKKEAETGFGTALMSIVGGAGGWLLNKGLGSVGKLFTGGGTSAAEAATLAEGSAAATTAAEGASVAGAGTGGSAAASAGPIAAALAGFWSIGKGIFNVADSEALNTGKGGTGQTVGNAIAGIGAEFVNVLDKVTFGGTKWLAEEAGVSVRGVDTSKMEQARAAYRQQTGNQIGMGEEGNQELVNWVMKNKEYLAGKGGIDSTVKAFEQAISEGKIKVTGTPAGTTTAATPGQTPGATPAQAAAATPANASVATAGDMNKILERVANSTNNTVIDLNNLYTKTSQVGNALITNGNTQIAELRTLNSNTIAMKELTRKIEALTRATYEGGTKVMIDGKVLASAATRYADNTNGTNPNSPTPISRGEKTTYGY
jgi:hypothetical protein